MRIGIVGATGYAGLELLRLLGSHPEAEIVVATGDSNAGRSVAEHAPALAALFPTLVYQSTEGILTSDVDAVFVALPHGHSQPYVAALRERDVTVIDLGADFRLRDADDYPQWYGQEHQFPHLLSDAVYSLVERHRSQLPGARLLAVPGCYPTATALALGPFVDAGIITKEQIIVNALSGVSGAGRSPSERLHFPRLSGNAEAYGLVNHRHTVEMQRELGVSLLFTPHLIPVSRGMLVTAYGPLTRELSTAQALDLLRTTYVHDPCVVVVDEAPALKDAVGSNLCFISARVDPRTGWVIVMSAIDNLIKGAAGQAVQAWNVSNGFDETLGLPMSGLTP